MTWSHWWPLPPSAPPTIIPRFILLILLRRLRGAASAAAAVCPVDRGSVAVQLYTQVAKVAAQQKQQDKQDKYRRERAASLQKLRTSGEADKLLQRARISSIGEQLRKQQQEEVDRVARAEPRIGSGVGAVPASGFVGAHLPP